MLTASNIEAYQLIDRVITIYSHTWFINNRK